MANKLYVFLHGTICLIEYTNYYRGIFIEMDGHRVSAGNFLTERTIPEGDFLELSGVPTDLTGTMDRTKNIVATVTKLDEIAIDLYRYAEIKLPKPGFLHSFRTGTWQNGMQISGAYLGTKEMGKYSVIQVFEYSVEDLTKIKLAGKNFGSWFATIPDFGNVEISRDLFCSLHIFNEPETSPTDDHFIEEFNRGCRILGVDLRMTSPLLVPDLASGEILPGTFEPETMSLETRVQPVIDLLAGVKRTGYRAVGDRHYCGTIAGCLG